MKQVVAGVHRTHPRRRSGSLREKADGSVRALIDLILLSIVQESNEVVQENHAETLRRKQGDRCIILVSGVTANHRWDEVPIVNWELGHGQAGEASKTRGLAGAEQAHIYVNRLPVEAVEHALRPVGENS